MIDSRQALIQALKDYKTIYKDEENFIAEFNDLLRNSDCYLRSHLPGHLTGSAFIIDKARQFALLTHHAKLNKWLQPGGHADGDENIMGVALREAEEETGLKNFTPLLHTGIFDIDIHVIPERRDFPQHLHYDVRFLLEASKDEKLIITEESHDLAWVPFDDVAELTHHSPAVLRMIDKVRSL